MTTYETQVIDDKQIIAVTVQEGTDRPYDAAKMQTLGMVSSDGIYSNVALLLSDQCPNTIKAATFAGVDQSVFQDRREFAGSENN